MEPVTVPSARPGHAPAKDATRTQIRSAGMLLTGRGLTIGINFAIQVLMVRYLSTLDYGAFAYALSVVAFCEACLTLNLREAVTRFVPMYHAQHAYGKLFGTIGFTASIFVLAGLVIIGAFTVLPESMARFMHHEQPPHQLLAIIIFLVPLEALDGLLISLFASFGSPRTIFFRRYVLGSGLKLGVVLPLLVWQRDVIYVAYGYLLTTALGVLISTVLLLRLLSRQQLFAHCTWRTMEVPVREILAFTLPLLVSDLLLTSMQTVNVVLLGYFHNLQEVALFRVVLPIAYLNTTIMMSFRLFYMPAAARLFAHNAYDELQDLYRQTAIWMAVLSFPIFAVTFAMAQPLVFWLYGTRYEASGLLLAMLAFACYFAVPLGFNSLTLKALGKLRDLLIIDVLTVATNVALSLLLIPHYGALGAAMGLAGAMIVHSVLKQMRLCLTLGCSLWDRRYRVFYLTTASSAVVFFFIQFCRVRSSVALPLVGLVIAGVLRISRRHLHIAATFPELLRLPLMRRFFG